LIEERDRGFTVMELENSASDAGFIFWPLWITIAI
jgi:hypothetical protein